MHGRRFADRYELESPLGRGGMAEVWRGRDLRLDRPVAVKILNQVGTADEAAIERFRREALAVARMAHPNIVSAYDFGTDDERPYLVMELVAGETLDARLRRGPLPVAEAVQIAAQACAALDTAHRAGVIHRDIKPANLIVTPDGTVKMLDFGIARLQDNAAALTRTATVVGTSQYMAPEQVSGGTADARTDLYALGCVLYALLTGGPPFEGGNPMGVLYQHLNATPRPVRELRPDVPESVERLVAALLAKDPAQRPASAADLRGQLLGTVNRDGYTSAMPAMPAGSAPPPGGHTMPVGAGGPAPSGGHGSSTPADGTGDRPTTAMGPATAMPVGRAAVRPPDPYRTAATEAPAAPPASGTRWAVGLGAAVLGVIMLAFLVLALSPEDDRSAGPEPARTSSPTMSPTGSPTAPPSTSPTDPAGWLAMARGVVVNQAAAGGIDGEADRKITEELGKIGEELEKGDLERAAERVEELRGRIDEFRDEGQVSAAAYQELTAALDGLASSLPATDDGDGRGDDGKDKGRGKGKKDND